MGMQKSRKYNKSLHLCFINVWKAYDSGNRQLLWKTCQYYGLTEKITNIMQFLYYNTIAQVRIGSEEASVLEMETNVQQEGMDSLLI